MDDSDAIRRLRLFTQKHHLHAKPLSGGQDGIVWQTALDRNSVIKAFYRQESYESELACYQRLADRRVEVIKGYHIPALISFDDELLVIEMELVQPPFIPGFREGKGRFSS
jgi:hypothetical protein